MMVFANRNRAFTLFEVMISMMVLVFAILATISILPIGLRAQQLARSQMFAASMATTMINEFHTPVATFKGISSLTPNYNGVPGTDPTNVLSPPFHGWAGQLRNASIHASAYQYNAEQVLTGWFSGVIPVPLPIARRLDSDNDEIGKLLDQGAYIYFPDPNFMQGFNQGAAMDNSSQVSPDPELQKLVFAFTGMPQQNALSSHPVESLPWYENYPFAPAWISMQAYGGEGRKLGIPPYDPSTGGTASPGHRSGILAAGRDTDDWSVGSGIMEFSDAGHAQYHPVTFTVPFRQGQEWMNWYKDRPLDDPDSSDEYLRQDPGTVGFYQGNGFYQGRNWRYFARNMGGLWLQGNGLLNADPLFLVDNAKWAYICFQRLSGGDDDYLGYPRKAYTNIDQQDNNPVPAYSVSSIIQDDSTGATNVTTGVAPSLNFPAHPPAIFHRSGWLPVRAMLTNPSQVCYEGLQGGPYMDPVPGKNWDPGQQGVPISPIPDPLPWDSGSPWKPAGWPGTTNVWGIWVNNPGGDPNAISAGQRSWNIQATMGLPQSSVPMATYEMRANYRDRAIDLWQAVMPTHSNLAVLQKNTADTSGGTRGLVRESEGGTLVDCPKYEYPPSELDRFVFLTPQGLGPGDTPIHPAQVLALSYLAHAAMMVTGYGPPFGRTLNQVGNPIADTIRMSWESLNWTYASTKTEQQANAGAPPLTGLPYPSAPLVPPATADQGIYKDSLFVAADAPPGATTIKICNNTIYPWAIFPGDEIVFEKSYYQWYYRYGIPWHGGGQIWDFPQDDPHKDVVGKYYTPSWFPASNLPYPNLNYKLQTFRVTKVTINGVDYTQPIPPSPFATVSAPPGASGPPSMIPPAVVPTMNAMFTPGAFTGTTVTITFSPPLPTYPKDITDSQADPNATNGNGWNTLVSAAEGDKIRRVCNQSDIAFARKTYEMCMQWAAAYGAENPNDAGAPRLATHEIMMDKPLALFDIFYDAANSSAANRAVRTPLAFNVSDASGSGVSVSSKESFYRWMTPSNPVPVSWFYGGTNASVGQHDNSHMGPSWWRNTYFDQMVHNNQLAPPTPDNDDKHFWLTKPFGAFSRGRAIKFWSVDWKSYSDAETAPSAPVDFAKHNRYPLSDPAFPGLYTGITPNIAYGQTSVTRGDGHSVLCGLPESLYVWTSPNRTMRYGDVVGGEYAGYLYQNWTAAWMSPATLNIDPPATNGQQVTADVHLGHWGADRNGNGRLDIGPVSTGTRMHAVTVGQFLYYDPVIRLNVGN